jgi:hypothetical protein
MNRTMYSELTCTGGPSGDGPATGVIINQLGEGDIAASRFWVHRDEAEDTIRMIADAFDLDVEVTV